MLSVSSAPPTPLRRLPLLREILQRPLFAHAEVLTDRELLDTAVRWVHVGEIPNVAAYLHGQELILSTGVGLRHPHDRLRYLERLADCHVAGVCIELGQFLKQIPLDMVALANRVGLPLVVFRRPVRFVDITEDVHRLILESDHGLLGAIDDLGAELEGLASGPDGARRIVDRLGAWLGRPVIFLPEQGPALFYGSRAETAVMESRARELDGDLGPVRTTGRDVPLPDDTYLITRLVPIGGDGVSLVGAVSDVDHRVVVGLALSLAAPALAGAHLRAAESWHPNRRLVERLISGARVPAEALRHELLRIGLGETLPAEAAVLLLRSATAAVEPWGLVERWLLDQGLHALVAAEGQELVAILLDPPAATLRKGVPALLRGLRTPAGPLSLRAGVGRRRPITQVAQSYREAEQALTACLVVDASPFYHELGAIRLLLNLRDDFDLHAFIEDELGPVLDYDRAHDAQLLDTLAALIATGARRQEVAERLAVHRQTLYYRMAKLEHLLGEDFLAPTRRMDLELALLAHRLVGGGSAAAHSGLRSGRACGAEAPRCP